MIGVRGSLGISAFAAMCLTSGLPAQPAPPTPEPVPTPEAQAPKPAIPAGTPVIVKLLQDISSKTANQGDPFEIELAADVVIDGRTIIPAGVKGRGQVVHSAPTGFGGRAGELILAARYLDLGGFQLKLRGFAAAKAGANNTAEALFIPVAGLFVTGTSAELKAGQIGRARTAADVSDNEAAAIAAKVQKEKAE